MTLLAPKAAEPVDDNATPATKTSYKAGDSRFTAFSGISLFLAIVFVILALYPIGLTLVKLFFPDGSFDPNALGRVLDQPGLWQILLNTVILVVAGGILAVIGGSVLAWLSVRTDAKIKWIGGVLPLLPFLLPALVGTIGWTMLLSPQAGFINVFLRSLLTPLGIEMTQGPIDIYSWGGTIFIYGIYMMPFTFLLVAAGLQNTDSQLEEQSRVSGAGIFRTIVKVTLPAVRPSLGAAMLLTVWFGFAFFSGPAILAGRSGIDVLSVRIVELLTFSYPADIGTAVGLSFFMLIAVAIAWYAQTRVLKKATFSTITGRGKATEIELGKWRWLGRVIIIGYIVISTVLPVLALLWVALRGYWSSDFTLEGLSFQQFYIVLFQDMLTTKAITDSLQLAVIGATIGMLVAAVIARFVQSNGGRTGRIVDVLIKIGAPIPAIVLAVGVLLAFAGPPFSLGGTLVILLLAYLAHFLPQATVNADAAAAQVGPQLLEASHISGAGDARTFGRISLPLMLPDLIAGWALLFLWMFGEVNASIILASTRNPVIGMQVYNLYEQGFYGKLAALAILVLLIGGIVVTVTTLLSRWIRGGQNKVAKLR